VRQRYGVPQVGLAIFCGEQLRPRVHLSERVRPDTRKNRLLAFCGQEAIDRDVRELAYRTDPV